MRKFRWPALFLLLIAAGGALFFALPKKEKHRKEKAPLVQKPFVIVIPSYNNSAFCERNLLSVLTQRYNNFRVLYIDDCSTDDTWAKAQEVISRLDKEGRVTLSRNQKNLGSLGNYTLAIHSCKDEEIVVAVDGDDFLAHEWVLEKLNRLYANPEIWMTYGNFLDYPTYRQEPVTCQKLSTRVISNQSYRKEAWVTTHLRTFYAALFKRIQREDLLYKGNFYPMAGDLAFVFPLLEMAGDHVRFVPDILYLYNRGNPLSDHKINFALQNECADQIRSKPPYTPLKTLFEP
jgi:glycosyltransferase involved in cell wall biosynthesis